MSPRADRWGPVFHILEELGHYLGIFLNAGHHVQQHPTAFNRKPPGRQYSRTLGQLPDLVKKRT